MHQRLSLASLCRLLSIWSSGTGGTSSSLPVIITVFFNKVKIVNINIIVSCHGLLGAMLGVISSAINKIHHDHHYYRWHHFVSGIAGLVLCFASSSYSKSLTYLWSSSPSSFLWCLCQHLPRLQCPAPHSYLETFIHTKQSVSHFSKQIFCPQLVLGDLSLEKSFAQLQLEGKRLLGKKEVIWNNAC